MLAMWAQQLHHQPQYPACPFTLSKYGVLKFCHNQVVYILGGAKNGTIFNNL